MQHTMPRLPCGCKSGCDTHHPRSVRFLGPKLYLREGKRIIARHCDCHYLDAVRRHRLLACWAFKNLLGCSRGSLVKNEPEPEPEPEPEAEARFLPDFCPRHTHTHTPHHATPHATPISNSVDRYNETHTPGHSMPRTACLVVPSAQWRTRSCTRAWGDNNLQTAKRRQNTKIKTTDEVWVSE